MDRIEELYNKKQKLYKQIENINLEISKEATKNAFSKIEKNKYYQVFRPGVCQYYYFKSTGKEITSNGIEITNAVVFYLTKATFSISYHSLFFETLSSMDSFEIKEITKEDFSEKIKDATEYFTKLLEE